MMFLGYEIVNDAAMLPFYALYSIYGLLLLFASIMAHELGHLLYFRLVIKRNIKLNIKAKNIWSFKILAGSIEDYRVLTKQQYVQVNAWGVLSGFFPIAILSFVLPMSWLISIPYIVGSWPDIKQLLLNWEHLEE